MIFLRLKSRNKLFCIKKDRNGGKFTQETGNEEINDLLNQLKEKHEKSENKN